MFSQKSQVKSLSFHRPDDDDGALREPCESCESANRLELPPYDREARCCRSGRGARRRAAGRNEAARFDGFLAAKLYNDFCVRKSRDRLCTSCAGVLLQIIV